MCSESGCTEAGMMWAAEWGEAVLLCIGASGDREDFMQ
jgi:hypothetical protein